MPLVKGSSQKAISQNIATERDAGKSAAQAAAIAYHQAGKDSDSARVYDINGWFEVEGNPLSKVGVFEYSGRVISLDLNPTQFYKVYRPAEELADPECIESFKLVPWINDHPQRLLGDPDEGGIDPEEHGVSGVIGEKVYFDESTGMLRGNVKVFSQAHADRIAGGKEELSIGYQCKYEYAPGEYNGEPYEYVQRSIRGNHVASVDQGRCGADVSVMDGLKFTIDSKEFYMATKKIKRTKVSALAEKLIKFAQDAEEKMAETPEHEKEERSEIAQLQELLKKVTPLMQQLAELNSVQSSPELAEVEPETAAGEDEDEKIDGEETKDEDEDSKDDKKAEGMDSKEISKLVAREVAKALAKRPSMDHKEAMTAIARRDELAKSASHFVGVFDHREMTEKEVAVYAAGKLGLTVEKGAEVAALRGYLHGRQIPSVSAVAAMDHKTAPDFLTRHLNKGKE